MIPYSVAGFGGLYSADEIGAYIEGADSTVEMEPTSARAVGPIRMFSAFLGDSLPHFGRVTPLRTPVPAEFLDLDFGEFGDFFRIGGQKDEWFPWIEGYGTLIPVGTVLVVDSCTIGDRTVPAGLLTFSPHGLEWSPGPEETAVRGPAGEPRP